MLISLIFLCFSIKRFVQSKKNVSSYTKRSFGITSFERKDRAIEPIIEILTGRFWESQTRVR